MSTFVTRPTGARAAVVQAQALLGLLSGVPLATDGVPGPKTASAYKALAPSQRELVDGLIKARNPEVLDRVRNGDPKPSRSSSNWISDKNVRSLIREVVKDHGGFGPNAPDAVEYLQFLLTLEPSTEVRADGVWYDANSVNGPYIGLFQIGEDAYNDVVQSFAPSGLSDRVTACRDPRTAAYLALQYGKLCIKRLRVPTPYKGVVYPAYTRPITVELLYSCHNQGVAGLKAGAKNALRQGGQSKKATPVIAKGYAQLTA